MNRALFLALALLAPLPAQAQASAAGSASAAVIAPIAVRQIADLDFGVIASGPGQAGSVTILPGVAAPRYGGGAQQACSAQGECPAPHFASFEVSGEAGRSYAIAAPASVVLSGGSGAGLRVDAIALRSASRPDAGPAGRLDPAGRDRFDLGGTLRLSGEEAPARYRVSIPVIVTYS